MHSNCSGAKITQCLILHSAAKFECCCEAAAVVGAVMHRWQVVLRVDRVQSYCWRKGTPSDLINYCNQHPECDALTLFFNGFSLSPKYAHCWASAFFKTARGSGGNLSLSTKLTLSPQAALFVKTSSWSPSPSDSGNPNASEARLPYVTQPYP